ncbi:hypothetical protein ACFOD0_02615 [Shewanella intestini]|uniref:Outer membrane beta-barrel protein n=1 Tax=Shewanella intestini TaxID=2017544 RepID=A0ABS5I2W9_9GAMM|nr:MULTISPECIES: hypothetical protein [Shewanella]MBR9727750.1 hypothetical protein [Shewanella intestini]MRG36257.1 hypothetical protein [Shewanella sp. XMDDZSB0408]
MLKAVITFLSLCLLSTCVQAGTTAKDKFTIKVGAFYANSDSYMNVTDPTNGGIYPLDFEDDLLLDEEQFLPFFEFSWHFNDRHHVYADWKSLHRTADTPYIENSWVFTNPNDDKTYIVETGAQLKTTLDIDIMRIGYGYDIIQDDDFTVGVSIGLHTMFIKTAFEGTIGLCGQELMASSACTDIVATPQVIDESITAPLPDFGVYGSFEFFTDWTLAAHAQYFAISYDDVEGALIDIRASVEAMICENWYLTLGYNYYEVDVDYAQKVAYDTNDFHIADYNLNYSFTGPMFSLMYEF